MFSNEKYLNECKKIINKILKLYLERNNIFFDNLSELERQVICNYSFGIINGINMVNYNLSPEQVAFSIKKILTTIFAYSDDQSDSFTEKMISDILSKNYNNTTNVIIHRGLESYLNNKYNESLHVQDLEKIIENIGNNFNNNV